MTRILIDRIPEITGIDLKLSADLIGVSELEMIQWGYGKSMPPPEVALRLLNQIIIICLARQRLFHQIKGNRS